MAIYSQVRVPACIYGSRVCYGVNWLQEGRIWDTSPSHTLQWSVLWLMQLLIMGDVPPGGQYGCYPPPSHHLCLYKGLWCCEFSRFLFKWNQHPGGQNISVFVSFLWAFAGVDAVGVRAPHGDPSPAHLFFQHKSQHLNIGNFSKCGTCQMTMRA